MIGWAIRQLVIWVGIGLAVYMIAAKFLPELLTSPGQPVAQNRASPQAAAPSPSVPNSLVYRADARGHVMIEGYANGAGVRFILDTGATLVALTLNDATSAGLSRSELRFDHRVSTANGVANVAQVTLREVRIGQFSTRDVPAVVVENLAVSLLGQSFLRRLDSYEMRDGVLTMNWN